VAENLQKTTGARSREPKTKDWIKGKTSLDQSTKKDIRKNEIIGGRTPGIRWLRLINRPSRNSGSVGLQKQGGRILEEGGRADAFSCIEQKVQELSGDHWRRRGVTKKKKKKNKNKVGVRKDRRTKKNVPEGEQELFQ